VTGDATQLPLWIKIGYTLFVALLVPVYLRHYGPANFLWFSDVALLGMVPGLWMESPLIVSTLTLAVVLPEVVWNLDFFGRLITGHAPFGLAGYMFDKQLPVWLRGLSLFHVALPPTLYWLLRKLGYDRRALAIQCGLTWTVLPLTYAITDPRDNINWVFGPGARPQNRLPPLLYLGLAMLAFPLLVH